MIGFWIAAVLLSAAAAALVIAFAVRRAAAAGADPAQALHRRQLAEIDELIGRGVMAPDEARAVRTEAGRRLLAAAGRAEPALPTKPFKRLAIGLAVLAPIAAAGLYLKVGSPGMPSQPYATRLAEWKKQGPDALRPAEIAAVLDDLSKHEAADPELLKALARAKLDSGDPMAAEAALRKALAVREDRADLWSMLGTAYVQAGDGAKVDSDARTAFNEALKRDPTLMAPRYYLARGRIAEGQVSEGLGELRTLASELPPDEPGRTGLLQEIEAISAVGGLILASRPNGGGDPNAINSAILGMVQKLATRLETSPDDPDGWVRLVRAYGVLGDKPKQDAALAKARARYQGNADILAQLEKARAGGAP